MTTILESADLAEMVSFDEEESPRESLSATTESDPQAKIEFHVQMRDWTIRDMEEMIIEASARQIVGRSNNTDLAKKIQDRVIDLTNQRLNERLSGITTDILSQPVMTPGYGAQKAVTMAEYIGLTSTAYLAEMVGSDGNPTTSSYSRQTRAQYLVERAMQVKFKREIEAMTNACISEVQKAIHAHHQALLATEKQRLLDALAKVTA
jgi:hypothetical protein